MSVEQWLESLGLSQYAEVFAENEITADVLPTLTDDDLRELGVKALGHRKKMLAVIAELRATPETDEAAQPQDAPPAGGTEASQSEVADLVRGNAEVEPPAPAPFDPGKRSSFTLPPPSSVASEQRREPARPKSPAARTAPASGTRGAPATVEPPTFSRRPPQLGFWTRLFASKFLFISILVHLVGGTGAAYIVVQHYTAKRKVTFQGGPPAESASKRALEHSVSVAKKKSGGAPPQARRIATAGLANISLPEMPQLPSANVVVPNMTGGLGGFGFGTGMGTGSGAGSGMGSGMGLGGGTGLGVKMLPPTLQCRCSAHERLAKLAEHGGSPECETAVGRALEWLKAKQNADGSWGARFHGAMTGFALLCYLGRCVTPDDPQYGEMVRKGADFLIQQRKKNAAGMFSDSAAGNQTIYEHGIATYALGELYALAALRGKPSPELKEAFEQGVQFLIGSQHNDGGWRYIGEEFPRTTPSDLSVTGWQFQALKVAKLNKLGVRDLNPAIDKAVGYLKARQNKSPTKETPAGGFGTRTETHYSERMLCGVGILGLQTLDRSGSSRAIRDGIDFASDYIRREPPDWNGRGYLYAWYYYSQAFFEAGGADWKKWNATVMPQLLANQNDDGSWKPETTDYNPAGSSAASNDAEVYRTVLCTLMLEVYYRYVKTTDK